MSQTLRATVDSEQIPVSKAIAAAARYAPLLVLTSRAFADLADELGGDDQARPSLSCPEAGRSIPLLRRALLARASAAVCRTAARLDHRRRGAEALALSVVGVR